MTNLSPAQKRVDAMNEFSRKYGQHWLVYLTLIFTASLSFVSGLILPFTPDKSGFITISLGGVLTAIYYSVGFVTNGEGAANYWFDKLTDHDKDNTAQKVIAGLMLALSVGVSLVTALAAAAQIAFLLGVLTEFQSMPTWAQEWVVWSIPTMWTLHAVSGMAFKALSDEAAAERDANSVIRSAKQEITRARVDAKANYWKQHAPEVARQLGELEAQNEIDLFAVKLKAGNASTPVRAYAQKVEAPEINPTNPSTPLK